jgi:hypothetical protein
MTNRKADSPHALEPVRLPVVKVSLRLRGVLAYNPASSKN